MRFKNTAYKYLFKICCLVLMFFIGKQPFAMPVYSDSTFPVITVVDTGDYYKVTINDQEHDSLFDVSYAWGTKPRVFTYVSVAEDDDTNQVFTQAESLRWVDIQKRTVYRWDQATYRKHPMHFTFVKNPMVINHTVAEILASTGGRYRIWSLTQFESEYPESVIAPYIYVCVDGGNYFNDVGQSSPVNGDQKLSSVYLGMFKKGSQVIHSVMVHELCHAFVYLPNIPPWFDHTSHYERVTMSVQNQLWDPLCATCIEDSVYCAPLSQMCFGIRTKYEDAGLWIYDVFSLDSTYIDTVSSKYFYEQADEAMVGQDAPYIPPWWNLHWNSPKIDLPDTEQTVYIPKSEQENRSLLVFASDSLHPGYFKCFSLGAHSTVSVIDNGGTGIRMAYDGYRYERLSIPNPCRDIQGWMRKVGGEAVLYDVMGRQIATNSVPGGVYLVQYRGQVQRIIVVE